MWVMSIRTETHFVCKLLDYTTYYYPPRVKGSKLPVGNRALQEAATREGSVGAARGSTTVVGSSLTWVPVSFLDYSLQVAGFGFLAYARGTCGIRLRVTFHGILPSFPPHPLP